MIWRLLKNNSASSKASLRAPPKNIFSILQLQNGNLFTGQSPDIRYWVCCSVHQVPCDSLAASMFRILFNVCNASLFFGKETTETVTKHPAHKVFCNISRLQTFPDLIPIGAELIFKCFLLVFQPAFFSL